MPFRAMCAAGPVPVSALSAATVVRSDRSAGILERFRVSAGHGAGYPHDRWGRPHRFNNAPFWCLEALLIGAMLQKLASNSSILTRSGRGTLGRSGQG